MTGHSFHSVILQQFTASYDARLLRAQTLGSFVKQVTAEI